jgi:hypothetical protein
MCRDIYRVLAKKPSNNLAVASETDLSITIDAAAGVLQTQCMVLTLARPNACRAVLGISKEEK